MHGDFPWLTLALPAATVVGNTMTFKPGIASELFRYPYITHHYNKAELYGELKEADGEET